MADSTVPSAALMQYTVETNEPVKSGEGKPRRFYKTADQLLSGLPGVNNLHENLLHGVQESGPDRFMGTRIMTNGVAGPYVWQTYNEVLVRVKNFGAGLVSLGAKPNDHFGLFSINRAEWVIAEHACYAYSLITVPLYDTLGDEAIVFIINETGLVNITVTSDKAKILLALASKLKTLKTLIIMDGADEGLKAQAKAVGITAYSFEAVEKMGADKPAPIVPTTSDTVSTICYTSGTTGLPKGVILTHGNILSTAAGVIHCSKHGSVYKFTKEDSHISYLPLAHIFERLVEAILTFVGGYMGFYQGDTLKLMDDIGELKPTIFASVPRLFNRVFDKVLSGVKTAGNLDQGGIKESLFNYAFQAKKFHLGNGYSSHVLWDYLVFSNVRSRLGGRVRLMVTGAAPISAEVIQFLRICFSSDLHEGYGQTETTGASCLTILEDISTGHLGVPLPHNEFKLVDVPSMNYTSLDKPFPRGEICIRGHSVFKGYYKAADKTAETLDKDGWCHTGDVGLWDDQGRLRVIDRVKNIFKLAQGEYVAPEKIEMVYIQHELVAQAFVYGDSLQAALVAVIVPDEDPFKAWVNSQQVNGLRFTNFEDTCKDEKVRKAVTKVLETFAKTSSLKGFEMIKAIILEPNQFTPESGLVTPTFKLKRHELKKKYQAQIDSLYAELSK